MSDKKLPPSDAPLADKVRVGVATMLIACATGFSAAWLLGKMKMLSMVFNSSWLVTSGLVIGVVATYYAVRNTGRSSIGALAARSSSGAIIALGTIFVVWDMLTAKYVTDTMTIMWLEGTFLRGTVPTEVAKWIFLPVTFAGAAIGVFWGAKSFIEQRQAIKELGEEAPEPLVSRGQLIAGIVVVAAGVIAYNFVPGVRDWVNNAVELLWSGDIEYVKDYLLGFGVLAPVVSATLMILQSIAAPIPAFVVTFTNGLLFGWFWGALLSWSSAMAGAALCFWIARTLGRPVVERLAGGSAALEVSDLFFERYGDRAVLIARLLPFVSFDIISYGAGLTSMGFWRFFWATGLGQLPATIVYSYLGQNMTDSVRVLFMIFLFTAVVFVIGATLRPLFMKKIKTEVEAPEGAESSEVAAAVEVETEPAGA